MQPDGGYGFRPRSHLVGVLRVIGEPNPSFDLWIGMCDMGLCVLQPDGGYGSHPRSHLVGVLRVIGEPSLECGACRVCGVQWGHAGGGARV